MSEQQAQKQRGERKVREGYVVSDKMDKTIVVALEDRPGRRRSSSVMLAVKPGDCVADGRRLLHPLGRFSLHLGARLSLPDNGRPGG